MPNLNILDVAKRTGSDGVIGLIEEVVQNQPEMLVIPARPKAGTSYELTRRTSLPTGAFRHAGEGSNTSKSTFEKVIQQMFFFDGQLEVDEAIVKADGGELGSILATEASGILEGSFNALGSQVWYGGDVKGFAALSGSVTETVDATGAGGSTTSAYLAWLDPMNRGVHFDIGNQGAMEMPEWTKQQVTDATGKKFMAWVSNLSFYIGLAVSSSKALWRIKNLTTLKPLNDALGAELLSKVPVARRANLRWFLNRDAALQLQKSRSAIGNTQAGKDGKGAFAPEPEELAGVPITVTDSLTTTEAAS